MRETRTDESSGGFSMKRLSRILPFLLATLVAVPVYAQQQDGSLAGRGIGRDGTTTGEGVVCWNEYLITNNGRTQVRERLTTKTGRHGRYSMAGLYIGRVRV